MGCSGLCSYIHKNFHIFGRIHNHQPLDVVIDATNAMFFFHNILSYKNVINGYNVDFLEDAIDAFFYFLEYNNKLNYRFERIGNKKILMRERYGNK